MARKEKNIHYLYKTTCNVTGRWYIGMHSTYNLEDGYMGSGLRLRRSIRKYGTDNHSKEILEFFDSRELLIEAEKNAITSDMIGDDMCMNLMPGGQGGFISEEQQKYRSQCGGKIHAKKMKENQEYRNKVNETVSLNFKNAHLSGKIKYNTFEGKKHSDKTKVLMSEKAKLRTPEQNSQYGTCWITKDGLNKKIKKEELDTWIEQGWNKGRN